MIGKLFPWLPVLFAALGVFVGLVLRAACREKNISTITGDQLILLVILVGCAFTFILGCALGMAAGGTR